ncbi:EAL domain-containing protein [Chitinimonas viridis]|uniref:EAL domain-containing protein n=1 Tax=Chitinimonas viridis TaxID=664880 RepID=A0ABT8B853_9NEIS|nr:EAL domain-containing protein [Chitinimonas viridis]MDN3577940.1 EAL domain-containing protein [Chitinimonas viridis]
MATLLVINDLLYQRDLLAALLRKAGYRVQVASVAEVMAQVRDRALTADMVVADMNCLAADIAELVSVMLGDVAGAATPVLVCADAAQAAEARQLCRRHGHLLLLKKPYESSHLLAVVQTALGSRHTPDRPAGSQPVAAALQAPVDGNSPGHVASDATPHDAEFRKPAWLALQAAASLSAVGLERLAAQRAAVIELGLRLASERDVDAMQAIFVTACQAILGARYAAVGLSDRHGAWHVRGCGLPPPLLAALAAVPVAGSLLYQVLASEQAQCWHAGTPHPTGALPSGHPPVHALLGVPLRSLTTIHGWMYVAEPQGRADFNADDEHLAVTLAAQLVLAYENLVLYERVQHYAGSLEREISQRQAAESRLQETDQRFKQLAENINEIFFLSNPDNTEIYYISPAYEAVWQQSCDSLYADPQSWGRAIHPDDHARIGVILARMTSSGRFDEEYRIVRPDDSVRWIRARGFPIVDGQGVLQRVAGIAEDITELKTQQDRITRLNRLYAVLSAINSTIVRVHQRQALFDETCRILVEVGRFGAAWIGLRDQSTLAIRPAASKGASPALLEQLHRALDAEGPRQTLSEAMRTGHTTIYHDWLRRYADGSLTDPSLLNAFRSAVAMPLRVGGAPVGILSLYAHDADYFDDEQMRLLNELAGDVSFALQYIEQGEKLHQLAYYDALTGLPNRTLFHDRLVQMLQNARHSEVRVVVIMVDLAHFRQLNDTLGRHIGDGLLQAVGERLMASVAEPCSIARVSADTFAVAVGELAREADATSILRRRIFGPLEQPFTVPSGSVFLSPRAGIAFFPDDAADAETLFSRAEMALKQAKRLAEPHSYYSPEISSSIAQKLTLEAALKSALDDHQFVLHYQPRVCLQSGHIVGAEALIRWQHPELGLVPPASFIPLAEESGLIVPIGDWVLREVCRQQASWAQAYCELVPIAVNLSAVQFHKSQLQETILAALADAGLEAQYLELELTESVVMRNPDDTVHTLQALRRKGIKLGLDDFGTGYSSLAYLKRFPFDLVKIDRTFVTDITVNPGDAAIATAVIAMAHQLKLKVVAEGVETEGQLNYLREQRCDEIQGYYFSPPLPADDFVALLRERRQLAPVRRPEGESRTVLLVDDEVSILLALKRMLRNEGYRVLTANSGAEGLEMLAVNRVQVIISDQRMPNMSGAEFLSIVKEMYPDTVRIILSGYSDLQVVTESVNRGAVFRFLTKPWEDEQLREHIRDAFNRYRPSAELR